MTSPQKQPVYLIVNADDYGYFSCVSRGIVEAVRHGIVTATGILATSPFLEEHVNWLGALRGLDLGVHLDLTYGAPVSLAMKRNLERWGGRFPGKLAVVGGVLAGWIRIADVKVEWRAQIDRCLAQGLTLRFLNSHEHVHMLPPLFSLVQELALEYGIPHIRYPTPEWPRYRLAGGVVRNVALSILGQLNRRRLTQTAPRVLGMSESGKLSRNYLQNCFPSLQPGQVYELMCHPGHFNASEVRDPRLLSYHNWEAELDLLTSPKTRALCRDGDIAIIGYRDLTVAGYRLIVRADEKRS